MSASKKHVTRYSDGNISSPLRNPSPFHSSSIEVLVNHIPTRILVDTGAAISLIHEDTLRSMQFVTVRTCSLKEVHTANSGFLSLSGLVSLDISIAGSSTRADVYITRDLVCPMILGRDWIQQHRANVCFSTHRLYIHDGSFSVPLLPICPTQAVLMCLSDSILIPPFHEKLVSGYVPLPSVENAIFIPDLALQQRHNLLVPNLILHIRNHHGAISITNHTRHPKRLHRHTPLGFIFSLPEQHTLNVVESFATPRSNVCVPSTTVPCPHCNASFSSDSDLYSHLLICCNKHASCAHDLFHRLVDHLDEPEQRQQAYLIIHRYQSLFDDDFSRGILCDPQHAINTGVHPPLATLPRRISPSNRQVIQDEVAKLLRNNIISPSHSAWASPVVLVKKRDGSPRFCIDYRSLNAITAKDLYPLPRIDDVIDRLNGSVIFSKVDLRSGYFQLPLAPTEREKTAFVTPDGLWQFNRLPQGLKNSPSVFQRLMNQTLGTLRWDVCLAYLDDIVIYSRSFRQHLIDVDRVCHALQSSNFKLHPDKCCFFRREISFLGHHINAHGCSPTDDNIRAILQFPVPRSSKAAHSFLQMVGFYRKFIPNFASISAPLNKFTRKGFPFVWSTEEQVAFDQMKVAITAPTVLALPDPSCPYVIRTDASHVGIGAVLLQHQPPLASDQSSVSTVPQYRPIAFVSRSLKPAEKRYSAIELECLAIWWSVTQKFHSYIDGQQFFLETDHKPLLSLMTKSYQNPRIERWMMSLQQYDMVIRHISGSDNTVADALSRYPVDRPDLPDDLEPRSLSVATQTDLLDVNMVTTRAMAKRKTSASSSPSVLPTQAWPHSSGAPQQTPHTSVSSSPSLVRSPIVSSPSPTHSAPPFFDDIILNQKQNEDPTVHRLKTSLSDGYAIGEHGVLFKQVQRRGQTAFPVRYLPTSLIRCVLEAYHNSAFSGGHFGIKRTYYKLRDRFFWPRMYTDIANHVLSCLQCKQQKPSRRKPDGHLHPVAPPACVWDTVAMDYVGPVPMSSDGNQYFIVLTDLFSKFVVTKPVPDNTAATAARFLLYDVFLVYGVPREIITDNGRHFTSSLYRSLVQLAGCCHVTTTPYSPQSNGQCERHNATLVPNLVALSNRSRTDWDRQLGPTTFNYNTSRHDTTGFSPFELMFARRPRLMFDLNVSPTARLHPHRYVELMQEFSKHITVATRNNILHRQQLVKDQYDQHRSNPRYVTGQRVLIRNRSPSLNKFSPKFIGPFTILKALNDRSYLVHQHHSPVHLRIHVRDLRPYD